jgi:LCP family protein required for cell wall assembly
VALVASLTVLAVLAVVTAAGLVWYGDRQIGKVDVETAVPGDMDGDGSVDIPELQEILNVLVVGSDSRKGLSREERDRLGTGSFEGTRTDTIILVQLDPARRGAAMLSFPRDLLVERCDGSEGRINGAFEIGVTEGMGGPTCLVRTVSDFTDIPIHHYAEINFAGFVKVVDTLGGVKMHLEEPIKDADAKVDLEAGCQTLSGREALGFVRVRKIDSDFGRIARQQRFIREVVDQLSSARIALDVPRLFRLVNAGAQALETDQQLSLGVMRRIAFSFRDLTSNRIDSRTVPAFNRLISGVAYVVADPEPAEALFEAFREGNAAPKNVGQKGASDVSVADVPPLRVLNGTTIGGLAAEASASLEARGFTVSGTANAEAQTLKRTRIVHPSDRPEEARLVAKAFPGARLVSDVAAEDIVVTLGADVDVDALREVPSPTGPPPASPPPDFAGAQTPPAKNDC